MKIRIKDKVKSEAIRRKTKAIDIEYRVKKLKFHFAGHVIRGGDETWVKRSIDWRPYEERRARVRPKSRWRDEMEEKVGTG